MDKPTREKQHCHGAHIYLVGANRFQNEMLAKAMKQMYQCKNRFTVAASLAEISAVISDKTDHRVLFYLDCFGLKGQELELLLDSACQIIQPRHLWALFNLVEEPGFEKEALNYGVRGFFYPDDSPDDFCKGTRCILGGEVWLSRRMASEVILAGLHPPSHHSCAEADAAHLSTREKEVLAHLVDGATNKEVAAELFISEHTLRTHLYHIYRKLKVHNRMQAVRWAEKNL
jgi:LuxR family transcriptional regulator of csgAB operon